MRSKAMAAMKAKKQLEPWFFDIEGLDQFETRLKVISSGICYSDIHMIDNDWKSSIYPLVPGHEVIGTVEEVGSAVSHVKVGDVVGVGWQRSSCLFCKECLAGNENLCSVNYKATIVGNHGGFSTYMITDSRFAFKIPAKLDKITSGPLLCGGITVYSALVSAGMKSGQEIGIIGIGGLGHLAVQFASKLGNKVSVFTSNEDKAEYAMKHLGASQAIVTSQKDPISLETPLDIILNTVDRPLEWEKYVRLLAPDGTLTFVGNPGALTLSIGLLLSKRRRVMGSVIGGRQRIIEMLKVAEEYRITPIIEKFPLEDANIAIEKIKTNKIRFRAVLIA